MMVKREIYQAIDRWVIEKEQEIISFLQRLISIPSVNPWFKDENYLTGEKKCQLFLAEKLSELEFEVKLWEPDPERLKKYQGGPGYYPDRDFKDRPNLAGIYKGTGNGRSLLLFGHIDVVSAGSGWTVHPYKGLIRDGKLYGRGAADMKAGMAAMYMAAKCLINLGVKLPGDIIYGSVVDEEAGGMGTLDFVDMGYRAEVGILAEPTNLKIAPLCRGILWGKIIVPGRSGHIEMKHPHWREGGAIDAIKKARLILDFLDNLNRDWSKKKTHPLLPIPCQVIPAQIKGGEYPTTYANTVEIIFNAQYLPEEKDKKGWGGAVKKEIEDFVKSISRVDPWLKENPPRIEWILDADCGETEANHTFVKLLNKHNNKILGEKDSKSKVEGVTSHTDMGRLSDVGVKMVNFGPGLPECAHQSDEFVFINDFINAIRVMARIIFDWTGSKNRGKSDCHE